MYICYKVLKTLFMENNVKKPNFYQKAYWKDKKFTWPTIVDKWKKMRRFHKQVLLSISSSFLLLVLFWFLLRITGHHDPLVTVKIFCKDNGIAVFFATVLAVVGLIAAINWKSGDPLSWFVKNVCLAVMWVTSTVILLSSIFGVLTTHLEGVEKNALRIEHQDKVTNLKDSLTKKFAYELKLAERPATVLKEQIKDLNQTIDSFTTATAVLTAAKTDLKKQLTLAKADGAIANEKAEAIKASFDSIAKRPIVSVDTAGVKSVPYDTLLILGLLIIISLVSSRFFKGFTMVPVKARRVYIPLVLVGVMLVLCFPYLQSLVWSSSEKRTPQEEVVVVQSPKDSIAPEPQKKKEISVVEIKEKEKTPSVAPTISVGRTKVVRRKIIPRYCPPKNGGGKMKLYNTKPPL